MSKKNRFKGDPHHVLRERLMYIIKDSAKCKRWIREFFEQVPDCPSFALRFTNKKFDNKLRDGLFDGEEFVKRLRNTIEDGLIDDSDLSPFEDYDPLRDDFQEWVMDQVDTWDSPETEKDTPIPNYDSEEDWLRQTLEEEHHKNRAKRKKAFEKIKNKSHPKESLQGDNVGIFPIAYIEYLEKQNDLLRKNAKPKGGKNGKRKNTK